MWYCAHMFLDILNHGYFPSSVQNMYMLKSANTLYKKTATIRNVKRKRICDNSVIKVVRKKGNNKMTIGVPSI